MPRKGPEVKPISTKLLRRRQKVSPLPATGRGLDEEHGPQEELVHAFPDGTIQQAGRLDSLLDEILMPGTEPGIVEPAARGVRGSILNFIRPVHDDVVLRVPARCGAGMLTQTGHPH